MLNFNPPSPCGEGPLRFRRAAKTSQFQSTLPVWGGTATSFFSFIINTSFQSTLPVWGGTKTHYLHGNNYYISIHPPRVGRDSVAAETGNLLIYFNPPSPCGEGRTLILVRLSLILFQSTLPVWGGT